MLWVEGYEEKAWTFSAALLLQGGLEDVVEVQAASVIPLFAPLTHPPTLHATQHGVVFTSPLPPYQGLHYWHASTQQLIRVPPPLKFEGCPLVHVHAMTQRMSLLTPAGQVWTLRETSASSSSPFASAPLAFWELTSQLTLPEEDELFPLSSARFLTFQHTACILTAQTGYIFVLPGGVCIDRFPVLSPVLSVHTTRYGYSGTGALLSSSHQLYSLISPPLSSQLARLTSASPHADLRKQAEEEEEGGLPASDTFASPSFNPAFPSLSAFSPPASLGSSPSFGPADAPGVGMVGPSPLIPGLPYPALSHMAAEVAASYGPSLQSVHQQQLLNRWMGAATATSPSHLTSPFLPPTPLPSPPTMLKEALATLQSPALPLSMAVSPSPTHWLHGHQWDAPQTALIQSDLYEWLQCMEPLKGRVSGKSRSPVLGPLPLPRSPPPRRTHLLSSSIVIPL